MRKKTKMRKYLINRKILFSILIVIIVSVFTLSIAYAALSTTLKISGTAKFQDASWGITVEESNEEPFWVESGGYIFKDNIATLGNAQILSKPIITGTSIKNFAIQLTKPGDEVDFVYKVTNTGNMPAMLSEVKYMVPNFSSSTNNIDDVELAQYSFYYNYEIYQSEVYEGEDEDDRAYWIDNGDVLCPGATAEFIFYSYYNNNKAEMPSSKITVSDLGVELVFTPGARSLCNGTIPLIDEDE